MGAEGQSALESLAAVVAAFPGGVVRDEQRAMVRAVAGAVADGDHLLVQAGTGTGKSLAYLCGVLPALARPGGDRPARVVVSTATLALQRQLVESDLPRLVQGLRAAAAAAPAGAPPVAAPPSYAVLKGRSNYACLHRVREGVPDEQGELVPASATGPLGAEVMALREWAQSSAAGREPVPPGGTRGDRDAAPEHGARAWRQVSVTARECLGQSCPYVTECFAELARARAGGSDVVVTNHALLAVDAVESVPVLPEHDVLVVDEAHELVARFTASASGELAVVTVERAARRAAGVVVDDDAAEPLVDAAVALSGALETTQTDVRLDLAGTALHAAAVAVRDAARTALSSLPAVRSGSDSTEDAGATAAIRAARAALDDVLGVAERVAAGSAGDVVWVTDRVTGPVPSRVVAVAPLGVAGLIRDRVLDRATTVLTSATLAAGGSFEHIARSLGLRGAEQRWDQGQRAAEGHGPSRPADRGHQPATPGEEAQPWRAVDVGSPFDHRRQGILYTAAHLRPPGRDGIGADCLAEIVDLVGASRGGTLGLFSSRAAAVAATAAVRAAHPDLPVLSQDEGHLAQLVRAFTEDPAASLFGTLSLWQGLDVPGDTCRLVLVDRIPFPRPDDPVLAARARAVQVAGGNGFMSVSAAHAALLLAQGAGRLIRRHTDRGVVAVLDSRLATARYAGFLRASLPPLWPTSDGTVVRAALGRLADGAPAPAPGPVVTAGPAVVPTRP